MKGRFTKQLFSKQNLPVLAVMFVALFYVGTNFSHHKWTRDTPEQPGVIKFDIKHYYAYLTAGIIQGDLRLSFLDDPDFEHKNRYFRTRDEQGNFLIITSLGLAILYLPFFLIAHFLAIIFGLPTDGYGSIYQFFIVFGGWTYAVLGFLVLKNLLLRYFSHVTTAITIILIGLGTNLYYYATYEAAMPHVYNFFLIILYLRQVIKWHEKPDAGNTVILGALLGLISLIRPTNILVLFLLILWDVKSWRGFSERVLFFLQKYYLVLLMVAAFIMVWLPQMLYWKMITGKLLYFSYGAAGASFYFNSPQILGSLFSFIKGWYIYTPVMLIATFGIFTLYKIRRTLFLPVLVLFVSMVYVLSSWWSWWFGGGFGLRAYIDIYGVMAIPLAAITENVINAKNTWIRRGFFAFVIFFLYLSWHQTYQYNRGMIHYCGMTKASYKINFLKFNRGKGYWQNLGIPDHKLARMGIYYYYDTGDDYGSLDTIDKQEAVGSTIKQLKSDDKLSRQITRYSKRSGITADSAFHEVAEEIYDHKLLLKNK